MRDVDLLQPALGLNSPWIVTAMMTGYNAVRNILGGTPGTRTADNDYTVFVDRFFHDYSRERFRHYSSNKRWLDHMFWQRRLKQI